jgi:hypothetical protein
MNPPVLGHALPLTWVVMMTVGFATSSVAMTFIVGLGVYPFFHLAVQIWQSSRRKWGGK